MLQLLIKEYKIKIKEALHIKWDKPILNQQFPDILQDLQYSKLNIPLIVVHVGMRSL